MSSRTGVHQLSNGLYISGRPEQLKERSPVIATRAVPYTGGDVKKSGELGKMYGVVDVSSSSSQDHVHHPHPHPPGLPPSLKAASSKPSSSSQLNSGSVRSGPNSGSGPLGFKSSNSGPIPKKYTSSSSSFSGPMTPITPTGLITSGPLGITPGARSSRSGNLESPSGPSVKAVYGSAVTSLSDGPRYGFKVSRVAMWVALIVAVMGLLVGSFLMVAVKRAVILVAVVAFLVLVLVVIAWNFAYREKGLVGFLRRYPNAELRGAADGQYVKVTGVVTCGSVPLESSFQRVPRCVFISTELYESPGCGGKSANHRHCFSSSGCRYAERYAADFYISDFQSGLRAFVKAGYGAKVAAFVKPTKVVDITKENKDVSPNFLRWLADRSLSSEDRIMHLKESYIKEGSTVSVMGTVQRHENILMIVPPDEPTSTGCQWLRFLLPTYVEGIVLTCDENQNADVIPV